MKKLLSLLNVVTISGTAVPITIAASPYEKQEKLNSDINYQQTNNLEKLNRNKRQTPQSLQNIITTLRIGRIISNSRENILSGILQSNHSILSRQEFLDNIHFVNIRHDRATFFVSNNENISRNIIFTVYYISYRDDLRSIILNTDFTNLPNNNLETILNEVHRRHDTLVINDLRVIRYSSNSAYLYPVNNSNNFTASFVSIELNPRNSSTRQQLNSFISNQNILNNINNQNINSNYILNLILRSNNINNNLYNLFYLRGVMFNYNRDNFIVGGMARISWNTTMGDMINSNSSSRSIQINFTFNRPWRYLRNVIVNTDFGEITDLSPNYIENLVINRYPELRNQINIQNISNNNANVISRNGSNYLGNVVINFRRGMIVIHFNKKIKIDDTATNLNLQNQLKSNTITKLSDDSNSINNLISNSNKKKLSKTKNKEAINKYNSLSKEEKQQKLNEINQHYQNLSENDKKAFKEQLKTIGKTAMGSGIIVSGGSSAKLLYSKLIKPNTTQYDLIGYMKKNDITQLDEETPLLNETENLPTTEAIEMESLLPESNGLTAAETLSVTEETEIVAGTETTVAIESEVGAAISLAPETLGLSLIIGGLLLVITGGVIWWINSANDNFEVFKHNTHNQYDAIEKYYKFLAHDQLKLDINNNEWNKIRQIYQENENNYQEFKNKIKSEIINFHKEDHSGWGGSITDDDINTLIKALFNNFSKINQEFLSNYKHGWTIVTNTIGSYFMIEEEK